jgi:hypothetical protein
LLPPLPQRGVDDAPWRVHHHLVIINNRIRPAHLSADLDRFLQLALAKTCALQKSWDPASGSPVFTRRGRYTTRGWTEWTQGFQFGIQILLHDATGEACLIRKARENVDRFMAPHLSHVGVHDHGFTNISTYGNLRRLALEGRIDAAPGDLQYFETALKVSGAVQAARWSTIADGTGFIHSFNGPHSLFVDTIRSCRSLVLAHQLDHCLMGEGDRRISLLQRAAEHIANTICFNVYFGKGRDAYDVRGRVAHESIFNMSDGSYRCPSTQQGYSPFSTWTRGLAWMILGAAEQLEFFNACAGKDHAPLRKRLLDAAKATADFYIANSAADGVPLWDTGAPGAAPLGTYRSRRSKPDNPHEPFDSSAAVIAAQGLLRIGRYLGPDKADGKRYWQAGLTVAQTVFSPPYLSVKPRHQGLILHSIYHRPNGWDFMPPGAKVPRGESSMWGDYHAVELAVYLVRIIDGGHYYTFFDTPTKHGGR